jgi:glycosyltransferase 2 family protein
MALAISVLLGPAIAYPTVLGALLLSAVAGVIAHIPAGLGVLEAVFVALLAGRMDETSVLAALIGYRAVYFLLPLLAATLVFLLLEIRARRPGSSPSSDPRRTESERD